MIGSTLQVPCPDRRQVLTLGLLATLLAAAVPAPAFAATAPGPGASGLPTTPAFERSGAGIRVAGSTGRGAITIVLRSRGRSAVSQGALTLASAPIVWPAEGTDATSATVAIAGTVERLCDVRADPTMRLGGVVGMRATIGLLDRSSGQLVTTWSVPATDLVCSRATSRTVVRAADIVPLGTHTPQTGARLAALGFAPGAQGAPAIIRGSCPTPLLGMALPGISVSGLVPGDTYQLLVTVEVSVQVVRAGDDAAVAVAINGIDWHLPVA
jgi:hypothetical protein